jgi:LPXTG-site transpeptidase (sortase) family protein
MAAKKKTAQAKLTTLGLILLLTACAAPKASPPATQVLPSPIARVTHAAVVSAVPTDDLSTPTPLAQIPIPKSDIEKAADQFYGQRAIQQISIPSLGVESKVIPVGWRIQFEDEIQSSEFEWDSPGADVGWVITSALPDETGNVILYGHNNLYGKIFEHLADLVKGDKVYLQTGNQRWEYEVRYNLVLPILGASRDQLKSYQKYLHPTQDARVTLISCWPPISNTHRVVIIGYRVPEP